MKYFIYAMAIAVAVTSCKKSDVSSFNAAVKAPLSIEFDNIAGSADLQLNTGTYTNASGENLKITKFKYYVSNFVLTNTDGTIYTVPQDSSYFLIDESVSASREPLLQVPEGEYKTLRFTVGVDSLRNTMDVSKRTGVLDPTGAAADMYWGWNSGYIFLKLEGNSGTTNFMYHVGGFGGYNAATANNLRTITLDLSARGNAKVKAGKSTNVHLFADALKVISGTTNVSIAGLPAIHSIAPGTPLANNYVSMFRHDHTEN